MNKAVFLDRDGVINELVYHQEQEVIDSPFTVNQFKLKVGVSQAIQQIHAAGYLVIVISNQPGVAKKQMTLPVFEAIRQKMHRELAKDNAHLDGEFYCLHHPEAKLNLYRQVCECRKPKPGLLLQAQKEFDIDLPNSWFIGDNLSDIEAGQQAGCHTILISKIKTEMLSLMAERHIKPDHIGGNLLAATRIVLADRP